MKGYYEKLKNKICIFWKLKIYQYRFNKQLYISKAMKNLNFNKYSNE